MAKRLLVTGLLVFGVACVSPNKEPKSGDMSGAMKASDGTALMSRDAAENAIQSLGIDGRLLRIDLNEGRSKDKRLRIAKAHLVGDLILLETDEAAPRLFALERAGLGVRWVSTLREPSKFPVHGNGDVILSTSAHYAQALDSESGRRTLQFVGGALDGLRRPYLDLPSTPTGGGVVGNDTFYVPMLPSPGSNKNFESFSLVTGRRGWGYRTSGELLTSPVAAGGATDPKVYFVTTTGLVTCMDASNYGYAPRGPRWEALLGSGTNFGATVTEDTRARAGALYVADKSGVLYSLNRITGERNWIHATGMIPTGKPMVMGNLCLVPMKSGMAAFDAVNVSYTLTAIEGPDKGMSFTVRTDGAVTVGTGAKAGAVLTDKGVAAAHCTLAISNEVLIASSTSDENTLHADGSGALNRASIYGGSTLQIGSTKFMVTDRGTDPVWSGKKIDGVLGRVADNLVVYQGDQVMVVNAWTGEVSKSATVNGRIMVSNSSGANIFMIGGDAIVYALYPR